MLDAYRDLLDGLTEESTTLRDLVGSPVPDDLNPEVIAILKDVRAREAVMLRRALAIMRGDNINLRDIANEPELATAQELTQSPEELIAGFLDDRGELVSVLINLTLKDWERKVPHWTRGETTMSEEVEDHLTWEEASLDRVEAALGD